MHPSLKLTLETAVITFALTLIVTLSTLTSLGYITVPLTSAANQPITHPQKQINRDCR